MEVLLSFKINEHVWINGMELLSADKRDVGTERASRPPRFSQQCQGRPGNWHAVPCHLHTLLSSIPHSKSRQVPPGTGI